MLVYFPPSQTSTLADYTQVTILYLRRVTFVALLALLVLAILLLDRRVFRSSSAADWTSWAVRQAELFGKILWRWAELLLSSHSEAEPISNAPSSAWQRFWQAVL